MAEISWSKICVITEKCKDLNEREINIKMTMINSNSIVRGIQVIFLDFYGEWFNLQNYFKYCQAIHGVKSKYYLGNLKKKPVFTLLVIPLPQDGLLQKISNLQQTCN